MLKVAFVGWRGMVGSVLMDRMLAEKDFKGFEPVFVFGMPSGALLVIGLLLGFFNLLKNRKS